LSRLSIHRLQQVNVILLEQIMRVGGLFQASGVHLTKAPSFDATAEHFELDLAEVHRQDLLDELSLSRMQNNLPDGSQVIILAKCLLDKMA
jgi:hypothetical protein